MLDNKINLSNPNDPKTKKYLQEVSKAIQYQVIALTEMHKALCEMNTQKTRQEKIDEFIAEKKHIEAATELLKKNAEILNPQEKNQSQTQAQADMEKLNALKDDLEKMHKSLTTELIEVNKKMSQCDRDIQHLTKNIDTSMENLNTLQAFMLDTLINALADKKVKNSSGVEVTVAREKLAEIKMPTFNELYNDPSFKAGLLSSVNNESQADQFVRYMGEMYFQRMMNAIDPDSANPNNAVNARMNNTEAYNASMNAVSSNQDNFKQGFSDFADHAKNIQSKTDEKNTLTMLSNSINEQIKNIGAKIEEVNQVLNKANLGAAANKLTPKSE